MNEVLNSDFKQSFMFRYKFTTINITVGLPPFVIIDVKKLMEVDIGT